MKKILVLNAPFGNGHKFCSKALRKELQKRNESVIELDYYNTFCNKILIYLAKSIHKFSFTYLGKIAYKYGFIISNKIYIPEVTSKYAIGRKKFEHYLEKNNITDVICTFPIASAYYISKNNKKVNFHYVITDYSFHQKWINKYASNIFVGDKTVSNIKRENMISSGIPIIKRLVNENSIYKRKNNKKTVTIILGADGVVNTKLEWILEISQKYNINIICGKNKKIFNHIKLKYKNVNDVCVYGFIEDIQNIYYESNIIITKSGGITCSEIIFYRKKAIIFKPQYGQEADNFEYLKNKGIALLYNEKEILDDIKKLEKRNINWSKFRIQDSEKLIIERIIKNEN